MMDSTFPATRDVARHKFTDHPHGLLPLHHRLESVTLLLSWAGAIRLARALKATIAHFIKRSAPPSSR